MITNFHTIGIIGHPRNSSALATHKELYVWLVNQGYRVIVERQIYGNLMLDQAITGSLTDIGKQADLAIVVGGDGNMLSAARVLAYYDIKVIGINCGSLGFLTDLDPKLALKQLANVLAGNFIIEKRFLLEVRICSGSTYTCRRVICAINEVVIHSGKIARMVEFEVYIDNIFAFSQRSDGLIVSTPTGSTAYALSAGGPIINPLVDAVALIPILPHTLSARPLVINSGSVIHLKFSHYTSSVEVNCDNQVSVAIKTGEEIFIQRSDCHLNLIHLNDYNYFNTLTSKLGWSKNMLESL